MFIPEEILKHDRIIIGGCGGGADIINALPVWAYLKYIGKECHLVGIHGKYMHNIKGNRYLTRYSKWVKPSLKKDSVSDRLFEPRTLHFIKEYFGISEEILFISRNGGSEGISHAIDMLAVSKGATACILIDGGGDSLFCDSHNNVNSARHSSDGDSIAIEGLAHSYQVSGFVGVCSLGIDSPDDSEKVIKEVDKKGGFLGVFDYQLLEKDPSLHGAIFVPMMKVFRSSILMNKADEGDNRFPSRTATGLYCAFNHKIAKINPLVSWDRCLQIQQSFTEYRFFDAEALNMTKKTFQTERPKVKESSHAHNFPVAIYNKIDWMRDVVNKLK